MHIRAILPALVLFAATAGFARGEMPRCGNPIYGKTPVKKSLYSTYVSWKPGQAIDVYFVNGSPEQRAVTEHYAREWTRYANIDFRFHPEPKEDDSEAMIVEFKNLSGNWKGTSPIGLGYTSGRSGSIVLSPDYVDPNVIQHEFGHSLGLDHEHINPASGPVWIPEKAYEYFYRNYAMDRAEVDKTVLNADYVAYRNWTAFDPVSVMAYFIPGDCFRDGKPVGDARYLSAGDAEGISKIYPGRKGPYRSTTLLYRTDADKDLELKWKGGKVRVSVNGKLAGEYSDSADTPYPSMEYLVLQGWSTSTRNSLRVEFDPSEGVRDWSFSYVLEEEGNFIHLEKGSWENSRLPEGRLDFENWFAHYRDRNQGQPDYWGDNAGPGSIDLREQEPDQSLMLGRKGLKLKQNPK